MSEPTPGAGSPMNTLTGLNADPDEVERRIAQWAEGFAAKAGRYQAAQAQIEQIRTSATSQDGAVRVTVRADGSITDLEFSERIRTLPLRELSARILTTMRSAQAKVVDQVAETMTDQLGDEDAQTRTLMLDEFRSRFPDPEPEDDEEPVSDKWDYDQQEGPDAQQPSRTPPAPHQPPPPPARPPSPGTPRSGPDRPDDDGFDSDFDPLRD
jgi:DNA-binding protein YbaB